MTGTAMTRPATSRPLLMLFGAWLVALAAMLAVLFIGEVLGQAPCNLCWFQRAFMFPLAVILGIAAWRSDAGVWRYALPLAVGGGLIAAYHTALYAGVIAEPITPCAETGPSCIDDGMLFAGLPIPALALGAFLAIALLLLPLRRIAP